QFKQPVILLSKDKTFELPAFDLVRAAVNLMVAGVLISLATSYKLPLSTTYVTFMVAMGSSLADRAWGRESAVYRVAGVLNVIGGWFFTALVAFLAAGVIAYLINLGGPTAIAVLLFMVLLNFGSNYIVRVKKSKELSEEDRLMKAESSSVQGVIVESASNIVRVVKRGNRIYSNVIKGLTIYDLDLLKKNKKQITKLSSEVNDLSENVFYFIKNLDESSLTASNFYINILGYLQDMTQALEYISKASHKHLNNNHKKLKSSQIKELKDLEDRFEILFNDIINAFKSESFEEIGVILKRNADLINSLSDKINRQIERTRSEESSPKNTTLYFSLLLESKDLLNATMSILDEYFNSYNKSIEGIHVAKKDGNIKLK
ncbi:MAG: inorganic phosphate transporter, partial [Flammeovirgaceae bacterium]|nr:inorganic phosphate transporter [Flammeovirgaceae bacterium]